jgi:maltooligosyltrehalose trehalohydrolase
MSRWGPEVRDNETVFRLWAPAAAAVELELADAEPLEMARDDRGWWTIACPAGPGTRYHFRIGGVSVADPASRRQSGDVHGWSVVERSNYDWRRRDWRPRPWEEAVFYELHAGLFGGFRGVVEELDALRELGITAIELMPIGDFPGRRNWGYDGVLPYAPDEAYGTPDDLRFLVDEAHARGLMVFLDVVYNHFGPDGNYLPLYAPQFFRSDLKTPWGDAIDFRQEAVQRFFIDNALYWLEDFRFDGLRFDAVHAIRDDEFLTAMGREIHLRLPDRHLVLENEDNDARLLETYRAQWNDDFHNTLHVMLTGEHEGYYADFAERPAKKLARLLKEGFAFQGEHMEHVDRVRGMPSGHLPPTAFVTFLQNHDQTGNRALGERLIDLSDERALKAAVALQLLSPQIPLLFMGEERGAREPFLFFTDHNPELAEAVRKGRAAEFAKFPQFASGEAKVPDPNAPETFERCRLGPGAAEWRAFYRELLQLRFSLLVPRLKGAAAIDSEVLSEAAVLARWRLGDGATLTIATNLSQELVQVSLQKSAPIYGTTQGDMLPPCTTTVWIDSA